MEIGHPARVESWPPCPEIRRLLHSPMSAWSKFGCAMGQRGSGNVADMAIIRLAPSHLLEAMMAFDNGSALVQIIGTDRRHANT